MHQHMISFRIMYLLHLAMNLAMACVSCARAHVYLAGLRPSTCLSIQDLAALRAKQSLAAFRR